MRSGRFGRLPRLAAAVLALAAAAAVASCGGSSPAAGDRTLTIAVDAPFSRAPYVGETIVRGVELAIRRAGTITTSRASYTLRFRRLDNALSARRAVENVRRAVDDDVLAIVTDGTGVDASWRIARARDVPICIAYQGGLGLVDPEQRPNVFRIAPTDHGIAFRLAEYLVPKGLRLAILTDDSAYGQDGRAALAEAFGSSPRAVALRLQVPADASDLAPQVLRARRAGADAFLVWGRPATIANVLGAARSSGWQAPVYAPPTGEDPLVRQQLADHPEWVDGLAFASGRMTAERGPAQWNEFSARFELAFGPDQVGVQTASGERVVQPPDYAMYSYDFVNVLVAALRQAGGHEDREALLAALNQVTVEGANGDERGFNLHNHEGVVDDDVYFARFRDMTYRPVEDDPLSSTLPAIDQTR